MATGKPLERLTIRGFRSIRDLHELPLAGVNVLIGANGAGKSNFVEFFRFLRALVDQRLQAYVARHGPADGFFFDGIRVTRAIEADLVFGPNRYRFACEPTADGRLLLTDEQTQYTPSGSLRSINPGGLESRLRDVKDDPGITFPRGPDYDVWNAVTSWQVYHFHDTSLTAGMRRDVGVEQFAALEEDASNLAAFLLHLRERHRRHYDLVRETLQRIAPFFDDFDLRVTPAAPQDTVRLTWRRKGSGYVFSPGHLSDGTLRFLCLAVVLTQPNPPTTIVLDEPELGLHPEALALLAGLVRSASSRMQVVLATQSPVLLNEFDPADVITVDHLDGASVFHRLDPQALADWLGDYSLGELWQKGTIRGGVNHA
jgi:predicted ATPase